MRLLLVLVIILTTCALAALFVVYTFLPYVLAAIALWWLFKDGVRRHG